MKYCFNLATAFYGDSIGKLEYYYKPLNLNGDNSYNSHNNF